MSELISREFLESIGVVIDDETYASFAEHYESTLSQRVIGEIVDELDEAQLSELSLFRDMDAEHLQTWIVDNVPQIGEIVEDEIAILAGEIAEGVDSI